MTAGRRRMAACLPCLCACAVGRGLEDGASLVQAVVGRHVHDPTPVPVSQMRSIVPADRGFFEYPLFGGIAYLYGFNASEDKAISATLANGTLWEGDHVAFLCHIFQAANASGDFVDVGANIGAWSIPIAKCMRDVKGGGGKVVAVEAVPLLAEHLEASVVRNNLTDMIDVYNYAVGGPNVSAAGSVLAEAPDEVQINQAHSNKGASSLINWGIDSKKVKTPMTTVDSILASRSSDAAGGELPHVFAMKVDVEGYEGYVMRGSRQLLRKPPCVLIMEVNTKWLRDAGTPGPEVFDALRAAGYSDVPPSIFEGMFTGTYFHRDFDHCRAGWK